jgi:hypothetical protein
MIRIAARYTVIPRTESKVAGIVGTFVRAVHMYEPTTDDRTFRLSDSRDILHMMCVEDEDEHQVHRTALCTLILV